MWCKRKSQKNSGTVRPSNENQILADLGFEEYFDRECLSAIVNCLEEINSTPSEIVKLRGARFADSKQQAEVLVAELKRGKNDANRPFPHSSQPHARKHESEARVDNNQIWRTTQKTRR